MSIEYILPFDPQRYDVEITEGRNGPWGHRLVERKLSLPGRYARKDLRNAVDFALPLGAEVIVSRSGIVRGVIDCFDDFYEGEDPEIGVWGKANFIAIEHEDETIAWYSHLRKNSALVKEGQKVNPGRAIAVVGKTGWQKGGSHLHFQVTDAFCPGIFITPTLPVEFTNYQGPLEHAELFGALV